MDWYVKHESVDEAEARLLSVSHVSLIFDRFNVGSPPSAAVCRAISMSAADAMKTNGHVL